MLKLKPYVNTYLLHVLINTIFVLILVHTAHTQVPVFNSNPPASATIYLDFDGHVVKGTAWNWDSTIHAKPSGLSPEVITEVCRRVSEDFRIFNLNITTDSSVYTKAPVTKRIRVIITPTYEWYEQSAGVSFINSFSWGDDTPSWVFTTLLENNPKFIGEATSHEIGHTLGLQHQSTYNRDCELEKEYAEGRGSGEIGWAPIMGVGYYKNLTLWTIGSSIEGCSVIQNDINILGRGFHNIGFRNDEHGNNREAATDIVPDSNKFLLSGIINNAKDRDVFKITLLQRTKLQAKVVPNNVAINNSGANLDLLMTLIRSTGDTVGIYNPKSLLNASFDTLLSAGIYYLGVDGTFNQNVSDYGSVGLFSLGGSLEITPEKPTVLLRGEILNDLNILRWDVDTSTIAKITYLEYSFDGRRYSPITDLPSASGNYTDRKADANAVYYRVRVILPDETTLYSNVVSLRNNTKDKVLVLGNLINNTARVKCNGDYAYLLTDETGRVLGKGKLIPGFNEIPLTTLEKGLILLKVFNQSDQFHFRLIKQ